MKKKVLAFLTAVTMVFGTGGVLPDSGTGFSSLISASASTVDSGTCGDNVSWVLNDSGSLTISGSGKMNSYDYYSKDCPWYDKRNYIKEVIIKNGVTSIGEDAFCGCGALANVTIPNSVTIIGVGAFAGCRNLTSIMLPNSLSSIDHQVFANCRSLKDISIPNSVKSIGNGAFVGCISLTSIRIPDGVPSIGSMTFEDCSSLKSITIPNSVTDIKSCAFHNCTHLIDITIPDNVMNIGFDAFKNCASLTSVTIPKDIVSIGSKAFGYYESTKNSHFKINCYKGTVGEKYAIDNGFDYELIGESKSITNCTITLSSTLYTYDGTAKKPSVTVKNGSTTLTNGTDYTVSYSSNTNAGTGKVTITGTGNYTGSVTKNFTINAKSISNATVTLSQSSYTYDGNEKKPTVTVKDGTKTLTSGTDYSVAYTNNINVGNAKVTVTGKGNYSGTASKNFTISEAPKTDISNCTVTLGTTSYTYDGTAKKPSVTVKNGSTTLTNGTDYTVSYSSNTNAGTGKVTITGTGNYTGSVTKNFTINAKSISNATVTLSQSSYTYDGNEKKPTVTVKDGTKTLTSGTDYSVAYTNNINVGNAIVTITGKGNFSGAKSIYFTIEPKPVEKKSFVWGKDNWNFINSSSYFCHNYTDRYIDLISDDYLAELMNNTNYTEYERIFNRYDGLAYKKWNGSCYGMAALEVLSMEEIIPYNNYTTNANNLYEINSPISNKNISSLVNYYMLLQKKDVIRQNMYNTLSSSHEKNIKHIISLLDENSTVMICYQNSATQVGHAVTAYDYEYGSFTINGVTYQGKIKICDPNMSIQNNEDYYIYFNNRSYNWMIPYHTRDGWDISSAKGAKFSYIGSSINEINAGGYLEGNDSTNSSSNYIARIDAASISDNRSITKVVENDGIYSAYSSSGNDIIEDESFVFGGEGEGTIGYTLMDSESSYKISQSEAIELDVMMDYENCDLIGKSKAGNSIVFDKKGLVTVYGESADYNIAMTFNKDFPTDWYHVDVSGSNANTTSLEMVENGWIISADNLEKVIVHTNNKDVEATTSFSTEYPSAFIYEIDENTIGIAVDTDNNGTYETTLNTESKTTISNAEITTEFAEYVFDDKAVEPIVTVKIGDEILKLGEDYTVEYVDNDKIGTAKIVVTGIGKYSGSTSMTFEIIAKVDSMLGDVNNDGKINVTDVSKTAAHVKGIRPLDENAQKSADVNGDNKINVTDIAKIAAHVKGIKPLN